MELSFEEPKRNPFFSNESGGRLERHQFVTALCGLSMEACFEPFLTHFVQMGPE
jgi:hypothetical protein